MKTKKHSYFGHQTIVPFLLVWFILLCCSSNIFAASNPPASFLKLPISVIWYSGDEDLLELTIGDFVKYGFEPDVKKTWDKMEAGKWILILTLADAFTGTTSISKMLFVELKSPNRAILDRIIVDGFEISGLVKYRIAQLLLFAAIDEKQQQ